MTTPGPGSSLCWSCWPSAALRLRIPDRTMRHLLGDAGSVRNILTVQQQLFALLGTAVA